MAEESNEDRFFQTFEAIINSVVAEKLKLPSWEKKLKKFQAVVQLRFHMEPDSIFVCHLIANKGDFKLVRGPAPAFDLEFAATPDDLYNFTNRTYSTANMILKKNQYGQRRLQIKKGGRHLGKLLLVSKLLVV
ncbi:MAG TPA: hypothetical protein VKK79_09830 [Candidatus Lokiarchaeia archaeon]|nr:hypothetical protein [Candidatus Lokiarchaeia archaeon]